MSFSKMLNFLWWQWTVCSKSWIFQFQSFNDIKGHYINDVRGTISAENLLFDLNKQTLDITSSKDNRINGNIVFQWKKVLEF